MSNKEGEVTFKVTDRRLFNPDGTLRAEIVEREQVSAPAEAPRVEEPAPTPPSIETSPLFVELLVNLISSAIRSTKMTPRRRKRPTICRLCTISWKT